MNPVNENITKYFRLARERENIKFLREKNASRETWTTNAIFKNNRFCNVSREDDKTTRWFRANIRDLIRDNPQEALAGIAAFRWFNKIETGQLIKQFILGEWDSVRIREKLKGVSPIVTGAYIIKTPDGMNKLDGVLWCIDEFIKRMHRGDFKLVLSKESSHRGAQKVLETSPFLGKFMTYQIIADARYTCLLENSSDINSWAQPGPGSTRGIGRIFYNNVNKFKYGSVYDEAAVTNHMRELLECSRSTENWPQNWFQWEMQTVQNWCCEFDKYCRVEEGGKMKRNFS